MGLPATKIGIELITELILGIIQKLNRGKNESDMKHENESDMMIKKQTGLISENIEMSTMWMRRKNGMQSRSQKKTSDQRKQTKP